MQLYFVSFQSPVNICSLQSPRLIETSIMDFRFHNYPLLSSLTLYSRNQNCNNYFHHVKQKYIKQNTSRYFYSSSSNPPGWLVADCGGGSGIYQICGGTGFSVQSSTAHLDVSCHVLSCHQLHPVTSFHMTSTTVASQPASQLVVFALYQSLWVQLYSNVDTVRPGCPTIIELLIRIFCFNVK